MQVNMEDSKREVQKQITLEVSTRVKVLKLPAALVSGVPTGRVGGRWVRVRSLTLVSVCPSSAPDCDRPASTPR